MFKYSFNAIKILFKYAAKETMYKLLEVIMIAASLPLSVLFTQNLIDSITEYINNPLSVRYIVLWTALLILCMLIIAGSNAISQLFRISIQRKLNVSFTQSMLQQYSDIEFEYFEDSDMIDAMHRMGNEPQQKILSIADTFTQFISHIISLVGLLLIFFQVSIWFSLSLIIIIIITVWADYKSMNMMNTMFNNQSREERKLSYYMQLLSEKHSLYELKIFDAIQYIKDKWIKSNKKVLKERVSTSIKTQKYGALSTLMVILWIGFLLMSLLNSIKANSISVGLFISIISSAGVILNKCETLSYTFSRMSQQFLPVAHYNKFMDLPIKNRKTVQKEIDKSSITITFDNVHFTYPKSNKKILNGVSFQIRAFEKVALVGKNGCGKSTLVKLLCGLYKPNKGRIYINGIGLDEIGQYQFNKIMSVVFQDYASYQLTLRENVALGFIDKLYDDASIIAALKLGKATDISNDLDSSLGKIEKEGIDISGGQWQKLAISRGSIANNRFVILDEPTASLDPIAESNMYDSFLSSLKSRGCLIISHRLASAKLADKIIVMDRGKIKEIGNHNELLAKQGMYAKMFNMQSEWYKTNE